MAIPWTVLPGGLGVRFPWLEAWVRDFRRVPASGKFTGKMTAYEPIRKQACADCLFENNLIFQ